MATSATAVQSQTLAQMIRAKHPGAYDDMDDATLEKNVLAKYPQYGDLPRSGPKPTTADNAIENAGRTPGRLEAGNEMAAKILGGVGLPTSFSDIPRWSSHLLGLSPDSRPFWDSFTEAVRNPTERNIVGAVPMLGPTSVALADEPTIAGKLGTLVGAGLGVAAAGQIRPGLSAAKSELAEVARTPENKLTPAARAVSRAAGAAGGAYLGPGGSVAGALGGPAIGDALLPKRAPAPNFYEGAYSPYAGESPKPVPITKSPYFNREAYQAGRVPSVAAKASPFAGATSSASPSFNAPLPEVPSTPTPQPKVAGINAMPAEVGIKGSIAKPSGRLVLSPEEARAESAMQEVATRRARQHGMLYAAGMRPAGGGRVPMTPTATETFEYPQRSAYEPPEAPYSRGGGAEGPYAPPDYAYRVHDASAAPEDFDLERSHAHATLNAGEAAAYQESRNPGTPQAISKNDLSGLKEGVDYKLVDGPNGSKWVKYLTPRAKGEFLPHE